MYYLDYSFEKNCIFASMDKRKIKSKSKKADGHVFKSILEYDFYNKQKLFRLNLLYEKNTFELMPLVKRKSTTYFRKHGKKFIETKSNIQPITYTPDFVLETDSFIIVVECKGLANERYPVIRSLFLRYLEELDKPSFFFEPKTNKHNTEVIDLIKEIVNGRR